ncbi:MAG: helix-turn-helix domain-containing protein [Alphaproteobacteria bacterium]|nr:helix-turn-helix domain-containing protein [Alphaproteobacteria bacterium]
MLNYAAALAGSRPSFRTGAQPGRDVPGGDIHEAGERMIVASGEELFSEGDTAEVFYKVISGTVRTSKLLSDARRQIDSFHYAGDFFGFEGADEHSFSAEAVEETTVIAFRRSSFRSLVRDYPEFADQLMSAMVSSLQRARDHMLLLGRKTPQEKIAKFLLDTAARLRKDDRIELPMRRADIADYLGLTKETVSRTLTQMSRDGLIRLEAIGRTVLLNDRTSLQQMNA